MEILTPLVRPRHGGRPRRRVAILRLAALTLALALATGIACAERLALKGRVVGVTDGDTVTLLDEQHAVHKIRLAGIDAPESRMPYGQKSKAYLATLVFGQEVVAMTGKQDRYGRTIGTLMLGQMDANLAMIQAGMAWHYKKYAKEQPMPEARAYALAEQQARANATGLWHDIDPVAPWDWRKVSGPGVRKGEQQRVKENGS